MAAARESDLESWACLEGGQGVAAAWPQPQSRASPRRPHPSDGCISTVPAPPCRPHPCLLCNGHTRPAVRAAHTPHGPHLIGGMLRWLLSVTKTTPERPTVVLTGRITLPMLRLFRMRRPTYSSRSGMAKGPDHSQPGPRGRICSSRASARLSQWSAHLEGWPRQRSAREVARGAAGEGGSRRHPLAYGGACAGRRRYRQA
jgi:hypothetical protein